ncbi:MAG TPA: hypothetical protein VKT80_00575, partial [Chloroflexota bacterium]|nr:hypothetical protein [Chloroflexota bacterium]
PDRPVEGQGASRLRLYRGWNPLIVIGRGYVTAEAQEVAGFLSALDFRLESELALPLFPDDAAAGFECESDFELESAFESDLEPDSAFAPASVLAPDSTFAPSDSLLGAAASSVPVVDDGASVFRLSVT